MLIRVTEEDRPPFQLRRGEPSLSVFEEGAVIPPLSEDEVLGAFRPGSGVLRISREQVEHEGLQIVSVLGAEGLPTRLREAHAEIRPGLGMTRAQFKRSLKELQP